MQGKKPPVLGGFLFTKLAITVHQRQVRNMRTNIRRPLLIA